MKHLLFPAGLIGLLVFACTPSTPDPMAGYQVSVSGKVYQVIPVTRLKSMMDNKDFLLVNVHIPYGGEILGTDLFIPYDEIEENLGKLPADKNARLVLYCRSGNMSSIAAKTLTRLEYKNVIDVEGGMVAWDKEGYRLFQFDPSAACGLYNHNDVTMAFLIISSLPHLPN